jgi:hypothetical protein
LIKLLIAIACVCGLAFCGATVKLGKRSFFGHVQAIWKADETQELVDGVEEKASSDETQDLLDKAKKTAKPYADKVKKGAKAGWKAVTDGSDGGVATDAGK